MEDLRAGCAAWLNGYANGEDVSAIAANRSALMLRCVMVDLLAHTRGRSTIASESACAYIEIGIDWEDCGAAFVPELGVRLT